jgi:hypothetical protein
MADAYLKDLARYIGLNPFKERHRILLAGCSALKRNTTISSPACAGCGRISCGGGIGKARSARP